MGISAAKSKPRAVIAATRRAIRNGEQSPGAEEKLREAYKELAVVTVEETAETLADKARRLVAEWPDLNDEQLGRIAGVLKAAGVNNK